jgi:hypothetical protein
LENAIAARYSESCFVLVVRERKKKERRGSCGSYIIEIL